MRLAFRGLPIHAWLLGAALLACSSPKSGTQTGDEGDVPTPSGLCGSACSSTETCCSRQCVALQNDLLNCGACGKPCTTGQYCKSGQCLPTPCSTSCASGQACCGGACCSAAELCCDDGHDGGPTCSARSVTASCPLP